MDAVRAVTWLPTDELIGESHRFFKFAIRDNWRALAAKTPRELKREKPSELKQRIGVIIHVDVAQAVVV